MPVTDATDPQAMMGQGAPALGGMGAPQGAGMLASPAAGLPPMQPGTPQTAMALAQIASNLIHKQKGVQYLQALYRHFSTALGKAVASQMLDDSPAKHHTQDAIKQLDLAYQKIGQSGPSQSPALTTSLSDIVSKGMNSGATA